jgi:hypothetical protein
MGRLHSSGRALQFDEKELVSRLHYDAEMRDRGRKKPFWLLSNTRPASAWFRKLVNNQES